MVLLPPSEGILQTMIVIKPMSYTFLKHVSPLTSVASGCNILLRILQTKIVQLTLNVEKSKM